MSFLASVIIITNIHKYNSFIIIILHKSEQKINLFLQIFKWFFIEFA